MTLPATNTVNPGGPRLCALAFLLRGLASSPLFAGAETRACPTSHFRILLQASLASGYLGMMSHDAGWPRSPWAGFSQYDVLSVGIGAQWRGLGVLVEFKSLEWHAQEFSGQNGSSPAHLQITYGATDRWVNPWPVLYAYSDLDKLSFRRYDRTHLGFGAEWRIYAVSPKPALFMAEGQVSGTGLPANHV